MTVFQKTKAPPATLDGAMTASVDLIAILSDKILFYNSLSNWDLCHSEAFAEESLDSNRYYFEQTERYFASLSMT